MKYVNIQRLFHHAARKDNIHIYNDLCNNNNYDVLSDVIDDNVLGYDSFSAHGNDNSS
jgi:hypothetical protein